MNQLRRVTCGDLSSADEGAAVELKGWVNTTRDHGGLIFFDLRDRFGITQVVVDPRAAPAAAEIASSLRSEDVVAVRGAVRRRPAGTQNRKLATGEIEIAAATVDALNRSKTPPFPIHDDGEVEESLRLRYRYLDLRRPNLQRNIALRHRAVKAVRDYLDNRGFFEIETPMLIKQTPEGARDFVVPSRLHPGAFYALPQSPQLFKQLLMVGGFHRYFQIARCFRDEDTRADRQPEFTQIDVEMTFPTQEDVIEVIEGTLAHMFAAAVGVEIPTPFPRLSHADAMRRFGSDKPDVRFSMELRDVGDAFAGTEFKIFADALARGHAILALTESGGAKRSRRDMDALGAVAAGFGAKGLAWISLAPDGPKSSLPKTALTPQLVDRLRAGTGAREGDAMYLVADERPVAQAIAGKLRLHIADEQGLRDPKSFAFCWVLEFPLFERDEETGALQPAHHPFTAPATGSEALTGDPLALRAQHYDVVLNGMELGSGSIRIHDPAVQRKIFDLLGYSKEEVDRRFGFLLEAFEYGAPPHGGIALGVDRIVLLMAGGESIREVIAFPKNQRFQDLMINAPTPVEPAVLKELHLRTDLPPPRAPQT
jgi:aspartyl-tRNA synthetase